MYILVIILLCIISHTDIKSISLTFSGIPETTDAAAPFTFEVFFSGPKTSCTLEKPCFLRAAFFKASTTNYFGFTQNDHTEWVDTPSDKSEYYQFSTVEGSWSGKLTAKANPLDAGFTANGPGEYVFKLGRYTSASSSASWSEQETPIRLTYIPPPTPTPVPPTPMPTPTPHPTPASTPMSTPLPSPSTAVLKPVSSSPSPKTSSTIYWNEDIYEEDQALDSGSLAGIIAPPLPSTPRSSSFIYMPILIISGSFFILLGLLPMAWKYIQYKE